MNYFQNKTLLVPLDFSEQATNAVDVAMELADPSTIVHVVHVVEPTPAWMTVDPSVPIPPQFDQQLYEFAVEKLKQMFAGGTYQRIQTHCLMGDPSTEILNLAKQLSVNLIVMPSHGRKGLNRLFLGSVAERVLRGAHCPVLILRE